MLDLDLAEENCQPVLVLFGCPLCGPLIEAAVVKDATNRMGIQAFAEQDMEWIPSDHAATDMREHEQGVVAEWVSQALFMCIHGKFLLFQTDLFVPFPKGTGSEVLCITLPTGVMRGPMGQS